MKLKKSEIKHLIFSFALAIFSIVSSGQEQLSIKNYSEVITGAAQFDQYIPLLKNKRVAIVTNASGIVGKTSLVDTLLSLKTNIKKIFGPEHGFRGNTDAGEKVNNNKDKKTGLQIISLYGKNKKPNKDQLKDVDILIYDIQDLGVRFYTYISSLAYVMEACAENNKELIVLDRPNPNGFYIDGPIMKNEFKSFLGMHNVPIVYGMTTGEYATMINDEGWLANNVKCKLKVIAMKNYNRKSSYKLPVKPSPNIPNEIAVLLYPSLGLFEGSIVSLGRGTDFPFQVVGDPQFPDSNFYFVPRSNEISKEPKYLNQKCFGYDLRKEKYISSHTKKINLTYVIDFYNRMKREDFFDKNFNYHIGNTELQEQIKNSVSEAEIRKSWEKDLEDFKKIRKKYLLYEDF